MSVIRTLICFVINLYICGSSRILVFVPTPSISHQVVFRPLTQELARRGHEVVIITTDPAFPKGQTPANLTEIDVHDISYEKWIEAFYKYSTGKKDDLVLQFRAALDVIEPVVDEQLKVSEVKKLIDEKQHFDLLILEAWVKPALVLSHIFKAPVIQMSSFGQILDNYEILGAPTHPFLYPKVSAQRLYNLTLWEKIQELYKEYYLRNLQAQYENKYDDWAKKTFGDSMPSIKELSNNVGMLFLNIHPIWEGNQPVPPSVIHTWGLHRVPEKELPKDLKSYIDESPNGVIYMSFGTNTNPSNLPREKIQMFINVFSQLPYNILWKWDKDELPGKTKNIRMSKWFPQPDILRHPKVKLFITQAGLQSTDEAIVAGVPLIGIPMLGDQWYNAEKYLHHKIGLKLDFDTITEEELKSAINTVIGDESYRKNIKRLGVLMPDLPQSPLERAVWWTEHVLRHSGAAHLRAPAANISWAEFLELELCLILFIIVLTISLFLYIILCFISKHFLATVKFKTL